MKLTWFGGTTLRIYIGGRILVADPAAVGGVDRAELVSGADRIFSSADDFPDVDAQRSRPRRAAALVDEGDAPEVLVHRLSDSALLVDAVGEPPLVLASGPVPPFGRWGGNAVVVVLGARAAVTASAALDALAPRLIAVAGDDRAAEAVLTAVGDRLGDTGFMALEPGMALEV